MGHSPPLLLQIEPGGWEAFLIQTITQLYPVTMIFYMLNKFQLLHSMPLALTISSLAFWCLSRSPIFYPHQSTSTTQKNTLLILWFLTLSQPRMSCLPSPPYLRKSSFMTLHWFIQLELSSFHLQLKTILVFSPELAIVPLFGIMSLLMPFYVLWSFSAFNRATALLAFLRFPSCCLSPLLIIGT